MYHTVLTHDMHEVDESEEHLVVQFAGGRVHSTRRPVVSHYTRTPYLEHTNKHT